MATIYARNIKDSVYKDLMQEAKRKGISLTELVSQIVTNHVLLPEMDYMNQRYTSFVRQELHIYKETVQENQRILKKNELMIEELLELKRNLAMMINEGNDDNE